MVGLIIVHEKNPSSSVLVKINKRYGAYMFLCYYIKGKYGMPSPSKLEDELQEDREKRKCTAKILRTLQEGEDLTRLT